MPMTHAIEPKTDDLERLAAAAAWRVVLSEAGEESSANFEAWLAEHPANALAWRRVQDPWEYIGRHATSPEAMALRQEALQRAGRLQRRRQIVPPWLSVRLAASIAAMAVVVAGGGVAAVTAPDVYRTNLGERRTITLADGSRVALDSGSLLKVRLGREARRLELVRGQARFDVAHDTTRPFSVQARDQVVIATGTSFNVDLLGSNVMVTLLEGRVTVLRDPPQPLLPLGSPPRGPILARLSAGEQFVVARRERRGADAPIQPVVSVAAVNLDRAVAWEAGQLVFEGEPLGEVAERVSRYSPVPLEVEGSAANLRISGVFNSGDMEAFIDAVQRGLPVRAVRTDRGVVLKLINP